MSIKYVHTNIVARDWEALAQFYIEVFDCVEVPPKRDLKGPWLDQGTGLKGAHLQGMHLRLPGYGDMGPTLEIYQYAETAPGASEVVANRQGFGHIAFLVGDVEQCCDKVLDHGGSALGQVTSKEVPGVGMLTYVYVADPEGNIIELQKWQ